MNYRKFVRPTIVALAIGVGVVAPGLSGGEVAGRAMGAALVWFLVKQYRPSWIAGWSGAWLFIAGVVFVVVPPPEPTCVAVTMPAGGGPIECTEYRTLGPNPVTAGVFVSTLLVLPSMIVWKVGNWGRRLASRRPEDDA